jgi:hypothetical protein
VSRTGKSTLCADVIANLILVHGKTVAVTSNSHAAIDNLLEMTVRKGVPASALLKVGPKVDGALEKLYIRRTTSMAGLTTAAYSVSTFSGVPVERKRTEDNDEKSGGRDARVQRSKKEAVQTACLVGATAYALSNREARARFDILFCEEASQVSVANFAAMAPCAKSAVLVGDQQQLEMPLQGAHPEAVRMSALSYFVGHDVSVVPPSLGLFLETSYRMPPTLCSFISNSVYSGALRPAVGTSSHYVDILSPLHVQRKHRHIASSVSELKNSGIVFIERAPIVLSLLEKGKLQQSKRQCMAEVQIAVQLVHELVGRSYAAKGKTGTLQLQDILVVAPVCFCAI